jgi:hypothetical protein
VAWKGFSDVVTAEKEDDATGVRSAREWQWSAAHDHGARDNWNAVSW